MKEEIEQTEKKGLIEKIREILTGKPKEDTTKVNTEEISRAKEEDKQNLDKLQYDSSELKFDCSGDSGLESCLVRFFITKKTWTLIILKTIKLVFDLCIFIKFIVQANEKDASASKVGMKGKKKKKKALRKNLKKATKKTEKEANTDDKLLCDSDSKSDSSDSKSDSDSKSSDSKSDSKSDSGDDSPDSKSSDSKSNSGDDSGRSKAESGPVRN